MLSAVSLLRQEAAAAAAVGIPLAAAAAAADGPASDPQIRCLAFAAPPCANEALAAEVAAAGWGRFIYNFMLPEDPVVPVVNRLLRVQHKETNATELLVKAAAEPPPRPSPFARKGAAAVAAAAADDDDMLPVQMLALEQAEAAAAAWLREESGCYDADDADTEALPQISGADRRQLTSYQSLQLPLASVMAGGAAMVAAAAAGAASHFNAGFLKPTMSLGRRTQRFSTWQRQPAQLTERLLQQQAAAAAAAAPPGKQRQAGQVRKNPFAGFKWTLGASLRIAALAAPRIIPNAVPFLGALLPAAAGLELLGKVILAITVPQTCPLGSQWVMSHDGLVPLTDRPLTCFPRHPQSLGLTKLMGLFPGHRMVSYRNRLAHLSRGASAGGALQLEAAAAACPSLASIVPMLTTC